jgi:large conductance mechanosensitive channel
LPNAPELFIKLSQSPIKGAGMGIVHEFKQFAVKGSVVDLAVGVVIGGAFGKIVTSLVNDIIMPSISTLYEGGNFSHFKLVVRQATETKPEVAILYGNFAQTILDFLIIAWCIFLVVKMMNRMKKKEEAAPTVAPPADIVLLTEIRDLLKNKKP